MAVEDSLELSHYKYSDVRPRIKLSIDCSVRRNTAATRYSGRSGRLKESDLGRRAALRS